MMVMTMEFKKGKQSIKFDSDYIIKIFNFLYTHIFFIYIIYLITNLVDLIKILKIYFLILK